MESIYSTEVMPEIHSIKYILYLHAYCIKLQIHFFHSKSYAAFNGLILNFNRNIYVYKSCMSLLASYFHYIQDLLTTYSLPFDHLLWEGQLNCDNLSYGMFLSLFKLISPSQKILLIMLCDFVLAVQKRNQVTTEARISAITRTTMQRVWSLRPAEVS